MMEGINKDLILSRFEIKNKEPNKQALKVDEILKVIGKDGYPYGFWLKKVKNYSYAQILAICKEAEELPAKYSKGGFIVNKLCKKNLKK